MRLAILIVAMMATACGVDRSAWPPGCEAASSWEECRDLTRAAIRDETPAECVKLKVSRSDDPAAGLRHAQGGDVETEWLSDVVICLGVPGSVGSPDLGGTIFFELMI